MYKSLYPALFILLLSISCFSQSSTQAFTTDKGDQLQVELKLDKDTIMLGETTFLSFEIKNLSGNDLYTGLGLHDDLTGRPTDYDITVIGENGKSVSRSGSGGMHGFGGLEKIPANGNSITKLFLPDWARFVEIGTYTITVKRALGIGKLSAKESDRTEINVSTKLKIIPTDNEKLGAIIDSLGKNVLGNNVIEGKDLELKNIAWLFSFIEDQRTIKYHIQVLEKFRQMKVDGNNVDIFEFSAMDLCRISVWALKKYNDSSALNALQKMTNSPNEFVRGEVAKALRDSPHPKALELLLKLQNDEDAFVRSIVVDGLGKLKTAKSTALLRKMLRDENKYVRQQARQYLDERKQK